MTQVEALGEWTAETTLAQDDNVLTNCNDNHINMELLHLISITNLLFWWTRVQYGSNQWQGFNSCLRQGFEAALTGQVGGLKLITIIL